MLLIILSSILVIAMIFIFLFARFEYVACDSNVCFVGKTALITGGSKGLGYEIALQLASRGCRIIIASRTVNENLKRKIIDETDNENIILEYVDCASFKSVRALAERLKKSERKIDILINNAGVGMCRNVPTEDGLNRILQINHYSAFLLTHLLIDLLKNAGNARIIFTSSFLSIFHLVRRSTVTPLEIKSCPVNTFNYTNSKFCAIVLADKFAEKLKKWNITSNSYQPGITSTEIFIETKKNLDNFVDKIIFYCSMNILERVFGVNPKLTSQTAVQIATAKEFRHVTGHFVGRFFHNVRPRAAYDKQLGEAIWKASEQVVQLKPEEKL